MRSIHRSLIEWVNSCVGTEVAVEDRYSSVGNDPVVTVALRQLRPAPPSAAAPGSLGVSLVYLVSCRAASAPAALEVLEKLLQALPHIPAFEVSFEPPPDHYWLAVGTEPRPSFSMSGVYRAPRPQPVRPRIRQPVELQLLPAQRLAGTVVTPDHQPIRGAEVRVVGSSLLAVTDSRGRFELPALPPEPREKVLLISYKDLRLQVPTALGQPSPTIVLAATETV